MDTQSYFKVGTKWAYNLQSSYLFTDFLNHANIDFDKYGEIISIFECGDLIYHSYDGVNCRHEVNEVLHEYDLKNTL